jgi:hypothetical protein
VSLCFEFFFLKCIIQTHFSDFVRDTMKGLVGQAPSDMRRPGRRKGPKKRSALDAIGIFQEIPVDGHEKLGEKALRMGPGIGIDIYGMRDHVGKIRGYSQLTVE